MISGTEAMTITSNGEEYSVMLEYPEGTYTKASTLLDASVGGVPLSEMATLQYTDSQQTVMKQDGKYTTTITASCVSEDTDAVDAALDKLVADTNYVGMFTKDAAIRLRSVRYIKIFTAMIVPLAVQYPLVDEATALGHVRRALFCSAFRKLIYFSGLLLLPRLVSAEAAFFSEPIADILAATMTTVLFLKTFPGIVRETEMRPEFKE